jgi:ribosomal-protein-alanine N-acetyltransferase
MELNFECLPENYSSFFFQDIHRRFPETFQVAEVEGMIQGYIMCRIERGLSKIHSFRPCKQCHVVSIAVRKKYRRRGIASKLLSQVMHNAQNIYNASECFLEVRITNDAAIQLYEKLGFTKVKKKSRYYLDGEDAYIMATELLH